MEKVAPLNRQAEIGSKSIEWQGQIQEKKKNRELLTILSRFEIETTRYKRLTNRMKTSFARGEIEISILLPHREPPNPKSSSSKGTSDKSRTAIENLSISGTTNGISIRELACDTSEINILTLILYYCWDYTVRFAVDKYRLLTKTWVNSWTDLLNPMT